MFLLYSAIAAASVWSAGRWLIKRLDSRLQLTPGERLAAAAAAGTVVFGYLALAISLLTGYMVAGFWLAAAGCALPAFFMARPTWNQGSQAWRTLFLGVRQNLWVVVLLLMLLGVIGQVLVLGPTGQPESTLIGWGDSAYHLDQIGRLATSQPFWPEQPVVSRTSLTYPFFVNFLTALLQRLGAPLLFAWYLPSLIFAVLFVVLLYFVARRLLEKKVLATLALALVLFGGGAGVVVFFQDVGRAYSTGGAPGIAAVLSNPPHQYTHLDDRTGGVATGQSLPLDIMWITPAISFFSHQRSFTVGAAIALLVILGWLTYGRQSGPPGRPFWIWLLGLGVLPLSHAHTALAMGLLFIFLFAEHWFSTRRFPWIWMAGALGALLIAAPQLLFLAPATAGSGHGIFTWWFGWMACRAHDTSWFLCNGSDIAGTLLTALWFWTKNFGIVFWGWLAAMIYFWYRRQGSPELRALFLPSLALFLMPNLIKLQPWEFDNNKVILYWWLLAVFILLAGVGQLLAAWRQWPRRTLLAVILICGCLAGVMDASTRISAAADVLTWQPVPNHFGYYGPAELEAADWIRHNTGANDAFLASDGPTNFIPMLTGRPLYLGYPGWLWTQGNAQVLNLRKMLIGFFLENRDPAPLCKDGTRWLMWDTAFLNNYTEAANHAPEEYGNVTFRQQTPAGERVIVRLRCPA